MTTPYITPTLLRQADTGVDWASLVYGHNDDNTTLAEITNICFRASEMCDIYCNQVLRSTIDTEQISAPSERVGLKSNGICRVPTSRWPVTAINSISVAVAQFPPQFSVLPTTAYLIENASLDTQSGAGAYSILIQPGYVSWFNGRDGYQIQMQYTNGWPNAGLTADVSVGGIVLTLDDVAGFLPGAAFTIYDGASTERQVVVSASDVSGPGTVTVQYPLVYAHTSGVLVSGLPAAIQQACIYLSTYIALTRGATALAIPPVRGLSSSGEGKADTWLLTEAYAILEPFRRVV